MDLNLKGKIALVCGSTQGIGKASAIELAQLGATIVLIARDEEKLKSTLKELSISSNQKHNYIVADFNFPERLKIEIENLLLHLTFTFLLITLAVLLPDKPLIRNQKILLARLIHT